MRSGTASFITPRRPDRCVCLSRPDGARRAPAGSWVSADRHRSSTTHDLQGACRPPIRLATLARIMHNFPTKARPAMSIITIRHVTTYRTGIGAKSDALGMIIGDHIEAGVERLVGADVGS